MYFAILILLISQFSFAADKPGTACGKTISRAVQAWEKVAATGLGRRDKCAAVEADEVRELACKKDISVNAVSLSKLSDFVVGEWADEGVFQIVARRSEQKILCRNSAFDTYLKVPARSEELNQKANLKFEKIKDDLRSMIEYREQLSSDLVRTKMLTSDPRLGQAHKLSVKNQEAKIEDAEKAIAMAITELPMGSEPEVTRAYEQMAKAGSFNEGLLKDSIKQAQVKYLEAKKFYFDHSQPLGDGTMLFCLDEKYRSFAVKSGSSSQVLDELLDDNSKFRSKIDCRFNATYGVGAKRLKIVQAGVLLASMAFWSAEMAAVKGFQWAKAATSGAGARTGAQALNTIVAVSQIQMACLNDVSKATIATKPNGACDPEEEFKRVVNESDNSYCGVALAWNSTYLAPHVLQHIQKARALRNSAAQTQLGVKKLGSESSSIKPRPSDDVLSLRSQGYTFENSQNYISGNGTLELIGSQTGSKFDQLVYKIKKSHPNTEIQVTRNINDAGLTGGYRKGNIQGVRIQLHPDDLIKNPDEAITTLLHETRHLSTMSTKRDQFRDRQIWFQPENKSVIGYDIHRADEIEARLTELALYKQKRNVAKASMAENEIRELVTAQQRYLLSIQPDQISKAAKVKANSEERTIGGFRDDIDEVYSVSTKANADSANLYFYIDKRKPAADQINEQIRKRLKYLENLRKRFP